MIQVAQYRRMLLLTLLLAAGFAGLGYRLVDLQVLRHEELGAKARTGVDTNIRREPFRGDIRDIRGNLLATSLSVKRVCADPTLLGDRQEEMARVLAPLLQTTPQYLLERFKPRVIRHQTNGEPVYSQYVVLKQKVRTEDWELIRETLSNHYFGLSPEPATKAEKALLKNLRRVAIYAEEDQLRYYPNNQLASHVLGFVGAAEGAEMVGKDGIEMVLNSTLSGVGGWRETEKDNRGRELVTFRKQDVEARDGLNVVMTIDSVIQNIVESELAAAVEKHSPVGIAAVVVRPRTGEVLAMASLPTYDPNNPGAAPTDWRRNRVVSDIAEPGSTFKIVVVAGALNDRTVRLHDAFDCEQGRFIYAGKVLRDSKPYGVLSVEGIITKSSNIGSAKIGILMGEQRLHEYITGFGFGVRTGIPLPGEVAGIVHGVKNWNKLSISRVPMGHEVATTPLQMVMAMAAIANEGWLMRPMLVDRVEDAEGNVVAKYQPHRVRQVVGADAARQLTAALKTVVLDGGTALEARLDHYAVAGKTGTAQKAGPGGYMPGKYYSSFIGFFPADNPELCISVVMDEPKGGYYGGQTAAPVFRKIADRAANYLHILPDAGEEPAQAEILANQGVNPAGRALAVRSH